MLRTRDTVLFVRRGERNMWKQSARAAGDVAAGLAQAELLQRVGVGKGWGVAVDCRGCLAVGGVLPRGLLSCPRT